MAENSKIEWTDSTWNVITGCSVYSPGCKSCYAMRLAGTRLQHHPSRAGLTQPSAAGPVWTGEVRFNEEWLTQPLQWRRPRMVFVVAHGDLFNEAVPDQWIDKVFAVMALAGHHTYQVLTKRSARMQAYLTLPARETFIGIQINNIERQRGGKPISEWRGLPLPNVWLGVSVEDQLRADERIPHLRATPAALRWISAEPLLDAIQLGSAVLGSPRLDWVVAGGESGPNARPTRLAWLRSLRDECAAAEVPFFLKQITTEHGVKLPMTWWPADLRVREFQHG